MESGSRDSLVGREEPLARLRAAWQSARAGAGALVLLSGEGGIGKTRLAEELAAEVPHDGALIAWGRCFEGEGAPAYWPWAQVIRALVAEIPELASRVAGPLSAIVSLEDPASVSPSAIPAPEDRFRLGQELDSLLRRAAELRPTLVLLDDLHWADEASLALAEFVVVQGSLRQSRTLLVATHREAEPGVSPALAESIVRMKRGPLAAAIPLSGLSLEDTSELVGTLSGLPVDDSVARAIHTYTEGNPFVVGETVRGRGGALTAAIIEALPWREGPLSPIAFRLAALEPRLKATLETAAAIGREFSSALLGAAAGRRQPELLEDLDVAEEARIVEPVPGEPGRYQFVHAILRESLYGAMLAGRRQKLHFAVAEALETASRYNVETRLPDLVRHFTLGAALGGADRAVAYSLQLGEHELSRFAHESAAATYTRARTVRESWPGPPAELAEIRIGLAEALRRMGKSDDARAEFLRAAELGRQLRDDHLPAGAMVVARAAFGSARSKFGLSDPASVDLLREGLAGLESVETPLRAATMASLAKGIGWADASGEAEQLARGALALARTYGDRWTLAFVLEAAHCVVSSPAHTEERLGWARELIALGVSEFTVLGRRWAVCDLLDLGDWRAARDEIAIHDALAQKMQQPWHLWYTALFAAMTTSVSGDLAATERAANAALMAGQGVGSGETIQFYAPQLMHVRREQGRFAELEPMLAAMETGTLSVPAYEPVLALLRAETGKLADARVLFDRLVADDCVRIPGDNYWLLSVTSLADVCAILEDAEAAAVLYGLLQPFESRMVIAGNGVLAVMPVAQALGRLSRTQGDNDRAAAHFESALATARKWEAPIMEALALAGLAACQGEAGTAAFNAARSLSERLGLVRVQGILAALARSTGPAQRTAAPGGLSTREAEVLRLLAVGWSNQRIASELVLSTNTVIRHVSNIYDKIDAANRSEATAWALANGLGPAR